MRIKGGIDGSYDYDNDDNYDRNKCSLPNQRDVDAVDGSGTSTT